MENEKEIEKMSEKLAEDQGWSKLKALSVLQSRYQSEKRLEEAMVVQKIMDREESKPEELGRGLYDES